MIAIGAQENNVTVTVKFCANFNVARFASNEWTVRRMAMELVGEELITLDGDVFRMEGEDDKNGEVTFAKMERSETRAVINKALFESIQARLTAPVFDLRTHNGEIIFANGKVHTFRAFTEKESGERVVQEKRGKKWKHFGAINADGSVTPVIPSDLIEVAVDDNPRYAEATANAKKKIRVIEAKANLLNDPTEAMSKGVTISFKGRCRVCNRTLTNEKSVASGIGPTCEAKQVQAAVALPTVHAVTEGDAVDAQQAELVQEILETVREIAKDCVFRTDDLLAADTAFEIMNIGTLQLIGVESKEQFSSEFLSTKKAELSVFDGEVFVLYEEQDAGSDELIAIAAAKARYGEAGVGDLWLEAMEVKEVDGETLALPLAPQLTVGTFDDADLHLANSSKSETVSDLDLAGDPVVEVVTEVQAEEQPRDHHTCESVEQALSDDETAPRTTTHNGIFTANLPNGHRTFKIKAQKTDATFMPGKRVVYLLTGSDPDHYASWTGFGTFRNCGEIALWKSKRQGKWLEYADLIAHPEDRPNIKWNSEESCRFCNRTLTTPTSAKLGYGPTCAVKHGLPYDVAQTPPVATVSTQLASTPKQQEQAVSASLVTPAPIVAQGREVIQLPSPAPNTPAQVYFAIAEADQVAIRGGNADRRFDEIMSIGSEPVFKSLVQAVEDYINANPKDLRALDQELQDFEFDAGEQVPLNASEILFCISQLGAMGCSDAEVEQFFDDLLPGNPHWYPNFAEDVAELCDSPAFLFDVCDAFVSLVTPVDEYVRVDGQMFRYQRDAQGYELTSCVGARDGEIVEMIAYPDEVFEVRQALQVIIF